MVARVHNVVGAARLLLVALLLGCFVVIVFVSRIGPVIATVAPGRGLHTGDALGLIPLGLSLFVLSRFESLRNT